MAWSLPLYKHCESILVPHTMHRAGAKTASHLKDNESNVDHLIDTQYCVRRIETMNRHWYVVASTVVHAAIPAGALELTKGLLRDEHRRHTPGLLSGSAIRVTSLRVRNEHVTCRWEPTFWMYRDLPSGNPPRRVAKHGALRLRPTTKGTCAAKGSKYIPRPVFSTTYK